MARPPDMIQTCHTTGSPRCGMMWGRLCLVRCVARVKTVNAWRWLRKISLRLDEARLKVDDVVTELIVLGLNGFVVVVEDSVVANLLFKLFDVTFFPLSKCSLLMKTNVSDVERCDWGLHVAPKTGWKG